MRTIGLEVAVRKALQLTTYQAAVLALGGARVLVEDGLVEPHARVGSPEILVLGELAKAELDERWTSFEPGSLGKLEDASPGGPDTLSIALCCRRRHWDIRCRV